MGYLNGNLSRVRLSLCLWFRSGFLMGCVSWFHTVRHWRHDTHPHQTRTSSGMCRRGARSFIPFIYIFAWFQLSAHMCTWFLCVCAHVCAHICLCVHVYSWLCVCSLTNICVCALIHVCIVCGTIRMCMWYVWCVWMCIFYCVRVFVCALAHVIFVFVCILLGLHWVHMHVLCVCVFICAFRVMCVLFMYVYICFLIYVLPYVCMCHVAMCDMHIRMHVCVKVKKRIKIVFCSTTRREERKHSSQRTHMQ